MKVVQTFQTEIPVTFYKEESFFVAYSPALDLAAQGIDMEEAQKNFTEVVAIFFEETASRGTLEDALLSLGWMKKQHTFEPPKVVETQNQKIDIPIFA
ncbi:MAG: hypothetical protein A3A97_04620 [Candidatus Terrybacteria bacterium RIFCSPLOWO2_01_FULL_40_23]|uniref:HicB-like antitoxin of toxin-antitoxin system domain-containing protein n=1 Tax=Candidatus Terrybacteria bacterium RIFCSPLOWO2_01_FULL_40_23 TaxID=1802366 RepID=A0A1G2PV27_9BACT|nr:MAG: hypothetical protein A3A97_04620 [Candidatus Terrybacteria bacterium RIFCSPLOWO2_01_FULL_40_23]